MRFIEGTTVETLSHAFAEWQQGARRVPANPRAIRSVVFHLRYDGQRFGQYFWNSYGRHDESWPALFYMEDPNQAFMLAYWELQDATA